MSSPAKGAPAAPFHGRRILRGLITFVILTVAGFASLFAFTTKGNADAVLKSLSAGLLVLALGAAVMDLLIGAVRY